MIERLIETVAQFDYPRELLEIQVLDDSTDETQQVACIASNAISHSAFRSPIFTATTAKDSKPARCRKG